MSCPNCIAERANVIESYNLAKAAAKKKAAETGLPVFILRTHDEYTISETTEPNTVEVIHPDQ